MKKQIRGTLKEKEPHPSALGAMDYIISLGMHKLSMYMESFSSCAIEGNRLGEICSETLDRIMKGKAVSDRYILGVGWAIKTIEANMTNEFVETVKKRRKSGVFKVKRLMK